MEYQEKIIVKADVLEKICHYLEEEPQKAEECLAENDTYSFEVMFENEYYMVISCHGVQYHENESNLAWTQAILYDSIGRQVANSEAEGDFLGKWSMRHSGNRYNVFVEAEMQNDKKYVA